MFCPFNGSYHQLMLDPYQAKQACQRPKLRAAKVIKLQAKQKKSTQAHTLQKVLLVAATNTKEPVEIDTEQIPLPDASEFTQDLIAAENLLHVYDLESNRFTAVADLLAALEPSKKPSS